MNGELGAHIDEAIWLSNFWFVVDALASQAEIKALKSFEHGIFFVF
jgi:hypothetical protein